MTAPFSRRVRRFVAAVAGLAFIAGCSPEALDLGEVTPPQPLPDPAVTTKFSFEADEMPPVTDGSFTIGTAPLTATFSGGVVEAPDNSDLVRSPTQAWIIAEGESGSIEFDTPASRFEFFFRNEFVPGGAPARAFRGEVQCDAPPDLGNNPGEAFGSELFARGSFNDWVDPPETPYNFVNLGGGTYQARFTMVAGSYDFKLANADWTVQYSDENNGPVIGEPWTVAPASGDSGNTAIQIPADGCYEWTITIVDDSEVPAPSIEVLVEEFVPPPPDGGGGPVVCEVPDLGNDPTEAFGAEMFARGAFNDWVDPPEAPYNFVNLGGGTYRAVFEMTAGSYDFKLASADWSIEYSDDEQGPTLGEPWQLDPSPGGSANSAILVPADGCYSWTITVVDDTAQPPPLIEVLIEEFVGSGGGGASGSTVRVIDVLGDEIESFDGSELYRRIEVVRDADEGESLIKRIEIDNVNGAASIVRMVGGEVFRGGDECPAPVDLGNNPAEAFGAELFARGEFNDWADPIEPPYNFVNNGGGTYLARFQLTAGSYAYKLADFGWGVQYADTANATMVGTPQQLNEGDTGTENGLITIDADGCYDWQLTVVDDSASPAPVIELLVDEYVPDTGGGDGEGGVGRTAVDDFEFTAIPQTEPLEIVLVYRRPDENYSGTQFVVSGDIQGNDQTLTCQPVSGFCFVTVTILPGGSVTYTILNDGVPDEGGEITVDPTTIVGDPVVFNFQGSGVPLTTGLPEAAEGDNEVVLYYKRNDDDYEGWGLHLFPVSTPDWTLFPTPGEYPFEGIDPVLGAYFIIGLPGSERLTEPYSRCVDTTVEGCDLTEFPESLGFIIHKGNEKDPGPDQFVNIERDGNLIFVRSGVNSVSTTPPVEGGVALAGAEAHWVAQDTLLWNAGNDIDTVRLLYSADAGIREAGGRLVGVDMSFDLSPGTSPDLPNATHIQGRTPWAVPAEAIDMVDVLITGQLLVVGLDADGRQVEATAVQFPLLLDDLYSEAAADATLGVDYSGGTPSLSVWAPTSTMVSVNLYDSATDETPSDTVPMEYDPASGIWSVTGMPDWDRKYYTYTVTNYAPTAARVVDSVVTDPYSVNISAGSAGVLVKSQMLNLDDADLKPADWDSFTKPPLEAPEDIVLYELHVRDFSALDDSVLTDDQGNFTAFGGAGDGTAHLADLAAAGLTHVHILPPFDIASVNEDPAQRVDVDDPIDDLCAVNPAAQSFCDLHGGTILEALQSYGPTDPAQQDLVDLLDDFDSFNWGYDPVHFNVPEGSYASDPNTEARVLEFRTMVKGLSDIGLRTVIDQVYNHTNASGHLSANSVLDKVVPGYYHRLDADTGGVLRDSCCDDTAAEHAMMDKFIVDSMVLWTKAYKVDGFRLDLMSFHPLATMERARDALQALTPEADGIDGSTTYIYGEGWNTGTPANDGRFVNARQDNLAGTGIGSFNDRIRDAVRGGGPFDSGPGHIDTQGFISGQFYDPNANNSGSAEELGGLLAAADRIRVAMAGGLSGYPLTDAGGNATTGGAIGAGYTADPQEIVNYVASHDGETLWDISQFKHPVATTTADRVRAHNLGNAIVLLGQGVPFLHAGQDLLRSKSMDRNSFNSGDWFNRLDFAMNDNNFAVGLPPEGDNGASLTEIEQVLGIASADPGSADIMFATGVTQEFLQIRKSSELFRLRNQADVVNRVVFHNTGAEQVPGMIVMSIDGCLTADYTPEYGSVVTVINARTDDQVFELYGERTFDLHPVLVSSVDSTVTTAFHDAEGFHVPARTAAVFVEAQGGKDICGFGANFAGETAFVTGDFNDNAFINAMVPVADTSVVEGTVSIPVGADQRYRIQSSDGASINCGGPEGGGPLFTPLSNGGTSFNTIACGAAPDELSLDVASEARYKFSLDIANILNPSLVIREQAGTGFPVAGGGCGVADAGNDNAEFFGTSMFVRGSFNNWVDPGQGGPPAAPPYQLINLGNSEFEAEFDILAGEHIFKIADADWAGPEYGASAATIALGMTTTIPRGGFGEDIPFTAAEDGCYNFNVVPSAELDEGDNAPLTLDLTVALVPQDTGEPTDTPLVRGGFNDWGEGDPLTMVDDTTFEAIVTVATPGDYEFKIASSDWAIVNCGGPHQDFGFVPVDVNVGSATTISCGQNPANLRTSFGEAGDYTFRLETANRNNPTLTIESFLGAGFNSEGIGQPTVYLKGDFNTFGLDNPTTAAGGGRLYFTTVNLTAGTYAFRFESADGVTVSCGTPPAGSADVVVGEDKTISCGEGRADLSVPIAADGDYRFQIDAGISGTALEPLLTVDQL